MWAYSLMAPRRVERGEVATPAADELTPGQVLLRTVTVGICGSDLPGFAGHRMPVAEDVGRFAAGLAGFPSHEVVGEVIAARHPDFRSGQLVVGWATGMNGLAELVVTEGDSLWEFDPAIDATTAVMLQPLACALYAVDQLACITGSQVAVIGLGSIGVLFTHALHAAGAAHVTGIDPVDRSDVAMVFGIDETVQSTSQRWAAHLDDAQRPSIIVEAVGHQTATLGDAVSAVAFGGQIYYFGIPEEHGHVFDLWSFLRKNLTLRAGTTLQRRHYLAKAQEHVGTHPDLAKAYVTHAYGLDQVQDAFERASAPASGRLKVSIRVAAP
jgi:L-iditol 2-dehydrogenase